MLFLYDKAGGAASVSDAAVLAPKSKIIPLFAVLGLCLFSAATVKAFEIYKTFQTPEVFLAEVFKNNVPAPKMLILDSNDQREIAAVFNRAFPQQRVRYWEDGERTVWIFDDIGKEGYVPTTSGFVINNGVVESSKVLIYRESRGEQVAEPSFLNQINGSKAAGNSLDKPVDNITGATLSVDMMKRMARTAITLDSLIEK
ncbi:MAG: FMN-binding protein [Gammaproteobacteria bacterium]|nr:FMN-binding protein [Gammaproteobacteria bacterium]MBU1833459.1 FMN-binding protein [Gammaproteobacteria bacterium]